MHVGTLCPRACQAATTPSLKTTTSGSRKSCSTLRCVGTQHLHGRSGSHQTLFLQVTSPKNLVTHAGGMCFSAKDLPDGLTGPMKSLIGLAMVEATRIYYFAPAQPQLQDSNAGGLTSEEHAKV